MGTVKEKEMAKRKEGRGEGRAAGQAGPPVPRAGQKELPSVLLPHTCQLVREPQTLSGCQPSPVPVPASRPCWAFPAPQQALSGRRKVWRREGRGSGSQGPGDNSHLHCLPVPETEQAGVCSGPRTLVGSAKETLSESWGSVAS